MPKDIPPTLKMPLRHPQKQFKEIKRNLLKNHSNTQRKSAFGFDTPINTREPIKTVLQMYYC